ncbi:MAG: alpha-ketoglutarate-dependent dioxygenase AlkB [Pseudomonadota bacterium]
MPNAERNGRHYYFRNYLSRSERERIVEFLTTIAPIWELRYPEGRPLPPGQTQRRLLRPVYWLGSWQFACLDYYRPPRHVHNRCVEAEPFPPVLAEILADVEARIRRLFPPSDIPRGYRLNTCLVNFYGSRLEGGRAVDTARVGEHRDFEPGPVASLSLGERALFQFVAPRRVGECNPPLLSQWLEDGSLQLFGGTLYKDRVLHRVQRVTRNPDLDLPPRIPGFRTRRINFTFRFVPDEHVVPFARLPEPARSDVIGYVSELAQRSRFFRAALDTKR